MIKNPRILIADGDESFTSTVLRLLQGDGGDYDCDCAGDYAAASAMLKNGSYDLLIVDQDLAGGCGLDVIKKLPENARGMQIILVTQVPSLQSAMALLQLPIMGYIVKPCQDEVLLEQIRSCLRVGQAYRMMGGTQNRLREWSEQLTSIESLIALAPRTGMRASLGAYMEMTLRNVYGALADMQQIGRIIVMQENMHPRLPMLEEGQVPCRGEDCELGNRLKLAILETINVLEKTKNAFKSKELGELRKKLELVIKYDSVKD